MKGAMVETTRMTIGGGSLERLFNLFDLTENPHVADKVRRAILTLGDCFPSGTEEDLLGVSLEQLEEIYCLAEFEESEGTEFIDLCREAGGLDAHQASHLIGVLERHGVGKLQEF